MTLRGDRARTFRYATVLAVALALLAAAVPAATARSARGPQLTVRWLATTPPDGRTFSVHAGAALSFPVALGGIAGRTVELQHRGLPAGATLAVAPGNPAAATLTWTPSPSQTGSYVLVFSGWARGTRQVARPRAYFVHVLPAAAPKQLEPYPLTGPGGLTRWAPLVRPVVAREEPRAGASAITTVSDVTPEGTTNLVQLVAGYVDRQRRQWLRVRLAVRPNSTTGWVPRDALGPMRSVRTHLVVDRVALTATLYRRGRAIFRTRVGVGKPYWPTPAGDFYVRNKLTGFGNSKLYGPIAFGTSARSPVLTDWPGGGFIGIHGTGWPWLLPGYVSHGCVRMANPAIRRLARLMPIGTPVAIR